MSTSSYWIGKSINVPSVWAEFESGTGYIHKFNEEEPLQLTLQFRAVNSHPLYEFEAVFKTVKALHHDLKESLLDRASYNLSIPLFVYSVERGSTIWKFLGDKAGVLASLFFIREVKEQLHEETRGLRLENLSKEIEIAKKLGFTEKDIRNLVLNRDDLALGVKKLVDVGLQEVRVSPPETPEKDGHFLGPY